MIRIVCLIAVFLLTELSIFAQTKPKTKPKTNSASAQPDMNKMLEDALEKENMTEAEKAEMRKMMGSVMPTLTEQNAATAEYPEFSSNKSLVPERNAAKISAIPKKKLGNADITTYVVGLFNKIMTKGSAAEIALVKSVLAKATKAPDIASASILAMLQGHPEAAMALSMKAVQLSPGNALYQNNMASLLTQYGYPEMAIPVLQKLRGEFPSNSTILNNLAYAWLGLGETDSAKNLSQLAIRANPSHPDAELCGGLIEESEGNTDHATSQYVESMEHSPNPFTEDIINKNNRQDKMNDLDFDKIRRSITIYEYFPEGWMKAIPLLTSDVNGYKSDQALKLGYEEMTTALREKIQAMMESIANDMTSKGEQEFVMGMAVENLKGLSFISKTAVMVLKILQQYQLNWQTQFSAQAQELTAKVEDYRLEYQNAINNIKGDACGPMNAAANKYMNKTNPIVQKFYAAKANEFRQWLNAWITWNWYVTGNPRNSVVMQDIGWVNALEEMYHLGMQYQVAIEPACQNTGVITPAAVAPPPIPNFTCPAVVSIPVGPGWQQLSAGTKDFDKNDLGIKKVPAARIPNVSIAYTVGSASIGQAGIAAYVRTANGNLTGGKINDQDDELVPLSKIPLDDLVPLPDLRRSKLARQLLNEMMTADCNAIKNQKDNLKEKLDKMMKSVKELEAYEDLQREIDRFGKSVDDMDAAMDRKAEIKKQIGKMQQETDKLDKYEEMHEFKKKMNDVMKTVEEMDAMDQKKTDMKNSFDKMQHLISEMDAYEDLQSMKQSGLQPSLSSGAQVPGAFTPKPGLFQ